MNICSGREWGTPDDVYVDLDRIHCLNSAQRKHRFRGERLAAMKRARAATRRDVVAALVHLARTGWRPDRTMRARLREVDPGLIPALPAHLAKIFFKRLVAARG